MNKDEYKKMFEAEESHWWYRATHDLILSIVSREQREHGQIEIFDAGCGTGRLMELMSVYGSVHGSDMADHAIDRCRTRGLSVAKADLNTDILKHDAYDLITCIDLICQKSLYDDAGLIQKFHAALKGGGLLILQAPAYEFLRSSHDIAVHVGRRYTKDRFWSLLSNAGFAIEHLTYRVTLSFLPILIYRFARKTFDARKQSAEVRSDVFKLPTIINEILYSAHKAENSLALKFGLPVGTSVFALARKKK